MSSRRVWTIRRTCPLTTSKRSPVSDWMSSAFASSADCASRMEAGSISSAHAALISAQISVSISISRPRIPCRSPLSGRLTCSIISRFSMNFNIFPGMLHFRAAESGCAPLMAGTPASSIFQMVIRFGIGFALTASALRGRNQRFPSIFLRNCPVYDFSHAATSSGVPSQTISPPLSPPSGPRSIR